MLGVILTPYGANSPYGWYAEITKAYGGKGGYLPQPGPYPLTDRFFSTRGEVGLYYDTQLGQDRTGNVTTATQDYIAPTSTPTSTAPVVTIAPVVTEAPAPSASQCPGGYGWRCRGNRCACFPTARRPGVSGLGDMIPTDAEMAKTYVCYTPVHSGWINTREGYLPNPWRFGWNPAGAYGPETSLTGAMRTLSTPAKIALAALVGIGGIFAFKKVKKALKRKRR